MPRIPVEQCLRVGLHAVFLPDVRATSRQRLEAVIRGWQRGAYLMLEIPVQTDRTLVFPDRADCSLRFLNDGVAYALESRLIDSQVSRRQPTLRVAWTESYRKAKVRQHERIEVAVPCTIHLEGKQYLGTVHDLSAGGCGIVSDCPAPPATMIELSGALPDGITLDRLPLLVRTSKARPERPTYLGCSFVKRDNRGVADIAFYVGTTVLRMRQQGHNRRKCLVVGPDADAITRLKLQLGRGEGEPIVASSLLDALVHTRLVVPSLIVLAQNWPMGNVADACRTLRASPAHKHIPIVVYGAGQGPERSAMPPELKEAGATDYHPSLPNREELLDLIERHTAGRGKPL